MFTRHDDFHIFTLLYVTNAAFDNLHIGCVLTRDDSAQNSLKSLNTFLFPSGGPITRLRLLANQGPLLEKRTINIRADSDETAGVLV